MIAVLAELIMNKSIKAKIPAEASRHESPENARIIDTLRIESLPDAAPLSSTKHKENANFSVCH